MQLPNGQPIPTPIRQTIQQLPEFFPQTKMRDQAGHPRRTTPQPPMRMQLSLGFCGRRVPGQVPGQQRTTASRGDPWFPAQLLSTNSAFPTNRCHAILQSALIAFSSGRNSALTRARIPSKLVASPQREMTSHGPSGWVRSMSGAVELKDEAVRAVGTEPRPGLC